LHQILADTNASCFIADGLGDFSCHCFSSHDQLTVCRWE
jgi:hypothetical protein